LFFFHNLNYDAVVETIPTCYNEEDPKKYPTVIAGVHLFKKMLLLIQELKSIKMDN